ncbi:PQQ-binding-like beta-propeller repeat protein [Bacteroidota bacterium]
MNKNQSGMKTLLLWPGIVIVILQWLLRFVLPQIVPETASFGVLFGLFCWLVLIFWWAFFSRAPRFERWSAPILMIVAILLTYRIADESVVTGMRGMMFFVYSIPVLCLAFIVWAVSSHRFSIVPRRVLMALIIFIACGLWTLLRCDGITGNGGAYFSWRWADTAEDRLLSQSRDEKAIKSSGEVVPETIAEWPGFRGPGRDGVARGLQIKTDWNASPPEEIWRSPVGPGCSSFAVQGDLFFTQEQRGEEEAVTCYNLHTGEQVWLHSDQARFWDSHAGAGPRSTPTLKEGRVYSLGATGILNVLHAGDGSVIWSRNAAKDTDVELPEWRFTSSPLVVGDAVIVAFAGVLIAYDKDTGDPLWFGPDGGSGYSSPHLMTIDGVEQVLIMSQVGASSVLPENGNLLWQHLWPEDDRIVQPAMSKDEDVLLIGGFKGTRRITVENGPGGWTTEENWTSVQMKPFFNDFVIHKGYAFGFFGPSLTCIDIEDGQRKWKSGRYGGQFILLADQDLLIVLTEKGDLALVKALPGKFQEIARMPAIKGKTWNHPAVTDGILLLRNTQEMVAFRLNPADS